MIHSEKLVLKFAQQIVEKFYLDYNKESGIEASFRERQDLLFEFGNKDIWTVSFFYGKMDYGKDVYGFLTIQDEDLKPLYFNSRGGVGKLTEEDLEGIWPIINKS